MHLKNSQYSTIMRMYDQRQAQDRQLRDERVREVLKKVPEYARLKEQFTELYAQDARYAVTHGGRRSPETAGQISAVELQMQECLEHAGFPADYLEMRYICPDCQDTGFQNGEKCHCFRQAVVDLLYDQSGLKDMLAKENFDHFRLDYYSDEPDPRTGISPRSNMRHVLSRCKSFISQFDTRHGNLLISGSTGVGKTFLSSCIARELLDSSHTVIYLSSLKLMDIIRKRQFHRGEEEETEDDMADYIYSCELLIIDDLGSELSSGFVSSQLFYCISRRLENNVSTIISTNLQLDGLQKNYSERISSRIIGNYELLRIYGEDIRIRKAINS